MKSLFAQQKQIVVFVTSDSIARIDLGKDTSVTITATHAAPRPKYSELATAVGQALALGQASRGKVWIFAEQLWSGRVALSADVINAITPEQLTQTLALEAEYDSGISPFTSHTSQLAIPNSPYANSSSEQSWWVAQVDQSQFDSVIEALPKWSGPLTGLVAFGDAPKDVALPLPSLPTRPLHQLTDSELGELATLWQTLATARPERLPVIRPPQRHMDRQQQRQLSLLGAAFVLLLCIAHFAFARTQHSGMSLSLTQLSAHEQQLRKQIDQLEGTLRATAADAKQQLAKREADAQRLADTRRRLAEHDADRKFPMLLLQALSTTAHPEHNLSKIELDSDRVTLTGIAINGQAVAKLAQELDRRLTELAWRVQPPEMSSVGLGSLVSFTLTLVFTPTTKTNSTARLQGSPHVQ